MNKKYTGYNEDDTKWDEYHRKNNMMTNREFFTSNSKGGFYEGMEWNGEEWIPNEETRKRDYCSSCSRQNLYCECEELSW